MVLFPKLVTKKIPHKKKLSRKAKELLSKINNDLPRYDNIDMLIKKIKNK